MKSSCPLNDKLKNTEVTNAVLRNRTDKEKKGSPLEHKTTIKYSEYAVKI
jgi:hypothetical protein